MTPTSLYLHIPFCTHRCAYCDFNTYAGLEAIIPAYTTALCREIEYSAASRGERLPVHTLFFGGGTPSLLPIQALADILETIRRSFDLTEDLEATLEANPGTLSLPYLKDLRSIGFDRLSLGMQSASPEELRLLERQHDYEDVVQAVSWARQAGFANLNLDLIFGLPYQSLDSWQHNLTLAASLQPEHLSLYALTLEHGTPMEHWVKRGLLDEPDPDLAADMYEWASEYLESMGYNQYEISNWARVGPDGQVMACRHNLQYWRCLPYIGLGAGAHGYADGVRVANVLSPGVYVGRMTKDDLPGEQAYGHSSFPRTLATLQAERIDRQAEMGEVMMMGLRLVQEGVRRQAFLERFGESLEQVYGAQIERLEGLGLLEWGGDPVDCLRLTKRGRLLGNQVFVEFI
jgi:oxygen-independent coproporphyrinogen-3 oxidase